MINKIEKWEDAGEWTEEAMKGRYFSPYLHALFFALRERYHAAGFRFSGNFDDMEYLNFQEPLAMMKLIADCTLTLVNSQKYTSNVLIENIKKLDNYTAEGFIYEFCTSKKDNILRAIDETEWYDLSKKKLHFYEPEFFIFYKKVLNALTEIFLRKYWYDGIYTTLFNDMYDNTTGLMIDTGYDFLRVYFRSHEEYIPEYYKYAEMFRFEGWGVGAGGDQWLPYTNITEEEIYNVITQVPQTGAGFNTWLVNNQYYNLAKSVYCNAAPTQYNHIGNNLRFVGSMMGGYGYNSYNEYHYPGDEWMPPMDAAWRDRGFDATYQWTAVEVPKINITYVPAPIVPEGEDPEIKFYNFVTEMVNNDQPKNIECSFKLNNTAMQSQGEIVYCAPMRKNFIKYAFDFGFDWNAKAREFFAKQDAMIPQIGTVGTYNNNDTEWSGGGRYTYNESMLEVATYQPAFKFKSA
jgi:hypothetical protein